MAIAESLHWYDREGGPAYQVPYADPSKGMRNTTLRDAKKMALVPSVTSILNIPAKPGLDRWKQNQILEAAYAFPAETGFDEWKKVVVEKASQIGQDTASKGTAIHAAVEQHFLGEPIPEYPEHVRQVKEALEPFYPIDFVAERSFSHPLGYGGKVDLFGQSEECLRGIVIDFKTKDFDEDTKPEKLAYPEMALQLDAYRHGLGLPDAQMINVFIDRETGLTKLYEWPEGTYFTQFKCLLHYWQLSKCFDSSYSVVCW